jgi:hypothetical protein
MITKGSALAFAQHWVESWNSHDMDRILGHYTDDFEMTSPYIISIMNEPSGTLKGKEKVGTYWSFALGKFPNLEFKLIDAFYGVNSVTVYYYSVHRGTNAAEFFLFDPDGKVVKSMAHYD